MPLLCVFILCLEIVQKMILLADDVDIILFLSLSSQRLCVYSRNECDARHAVSVLYMTPQVNETQYPYSERPSIPEAYHFEVCKGYGRLGCQEIKRHKNTNTVNTISVFVFLVGSLSLQKRRDSL